MLRRVVKEFGIKGCTECCFCTGGHLFAAANNNSITIYNVYTFEAVASFRCGSPCAHAVACMGQSSLCRNASGDVTNSMAQSTLMPRYGATG